jgi:purine nucleosidase
MRQWFVLCLMLCAGAASARAPVIFDTDIGTDIDDAYALVALMGRPELEVLGVTTVSGDAVARGRARSR